MANGTTYNWRYIALGVIAVILVLFVILWLADVFQATTEQPPTEELETEITPEADATQPETEEPQQ